jgi:hypothetical protein
MLAMMTFIIVKHFGQVYVKQLGWNKVLRIFGPKRELEKTA